MPPGPGSGADARAMLIPWYAERPTTLAEEYLVVRDAPMIDLGAPLAYAGTLKSAVEKAQGLFAADDRPLLIVHQSFVQVAVVGKEPPQ